MRNFKLVFLAVLCIAGTESYSQLTDVMSTLKAFTPDTSEGWEMENTINLNASQASFTNWAAGGRNSLSLNALFSMDANYRAEKTNWDNSAEFGYGVMNQSDGNGFIKTDDRLEMATKYGFKILKQWYFSGLITLRTQINKGYYYPNDSVVISKFMAPGYFVGALGMDFKPSGDISVFISPVTIKTTFVLDKVLSDSGMYGVERGQRARSEVGGFVRILYKKDLVENISFDFKLDLFSNYLQKPQNIDINWEMRLILKIYRMLNASINTTLLYDDDVKLEIDSDRDGNIDRRGPRIQFRELFGVGLTFSF